MKRKLAIAVVLLSSLLLLLPALAQGPRGGSGPGGIGHGGPGGGRGFGPGPEMGGIPPRRLLERLDFTEEQFAALDLLISEHRTATQPLHDEVRTLQEQLRSELESETANPAVVGQLVIDIHNLRSQLRDARQALHDGFLALLTEEQLATLKAFEDRRPGRGGRRGPRGGGPGAGTGNGN